MSDITEVKYNLIERDKLNPDELEDLMEAKQARKEGYAPYSEFLVGSAITAGDGQLYTGWNLETAVDDGLHAIENVLGQMPAKSRDSGLIRITVVGGPKGNEFAEPVTPCEPCRQKLLEFVRPEDNPQIIMAGISGKVLRMFLKNQLPPGFHPACAVKK